MKNVKRIILAILSILLLYLFLYPVKIDPVPYHPEPIDEKWTYFMNNNLKDNKIQKIGKCHHCEDVAIDSSENIYGAQEDGKIIVTYSDGLPGVFADTEGRPLGIHFDDNGHLIVADSPKGLLSISPKGEVITLSNSHNNVPYLFADDLEIDSSGIIYFTDASSKYAVEEFTLDLFEHRPHGRFLSYDPSTKKTELLIDSMYFPNGVAVSHDNDFVLINETGTYRVWKYWIAGENKGKKEVFADNLPGFPDGISRGENGIFWLTLISPRKSALDGIMPYPFLRKMVVRLPKSIQPKSGTWTMILGLDKDGNVIESFHDSKGEHSQISSVQQYGNKLYLGSLFEETIGVLELPKK
jgi:sugar lactone lactonase YvrE